MQTGAEIQRPTGLETEKCGRGVVRLILMLSLAAAISMGPQASRAACIYDLSPSGRTHGNGVATNTIGVGTFSGCGWNATTTNNWVGIVAGGSGSGGGTVTYSIQA